MSFIEQLVLSVLFLFLLFCYLHSNFFFLAWNCFLKSCDLLQFLKPRLSASLLTYLSENFDGYKRVPQLSARAFFYKVMKPLRFVVWFARQWLFWLWRINSMHCTWGLLTCLLWGQHKYIFTASEWVNWWIAREGLVMLGWDPGE